MPIDLSMIVVTGVHVAIVLAAALIFCLFWQERERGFGRYIFFGAICGVMIGFVHFGFLKSPLSEQLSHSVFYAAWPIAFNVGLLGGVAAGLAGIATTIVSVLGLSLLESHSPSITITDFDLIPLLVLFVTGIILNITHLHDQNLPSFYRIVMMNVIGASVLTFLLIINPHIAKTPPYLSDTVYIIISPIISLLSGSLAIFSCARSAHKTAAKHEELTLWKECLQAIPDGILCIDAKGGGRIYASNDRTSSLLGYSIEEMKRRSLRDLEYNPGDPLTISRYLDSECEAVEGRFLTKSGRPITLAVTVNKTTTSQGPLFLLAMRPLNTSREIKIAHSGDDYSVDRDDNDVKNEEAASSTHDQLTGLPCVQSFIEQGEKNLKTTSLDTIGDVTIVLIDIDDMSGFNEQHGFAMGNALLATLARCIVKSLRGGDRAYRLGDDVFGIIMPGRGVGAFKKLRERIEDIMISVYTAGFPDVTVTIGFAAGSEAGNIIEDMMKLASSRVAEAKPQSSRKPGDNL